MSALKSATLIRMVPTDRAEVIGCVYGASTIGACGEPVAAGATHCPRHSHETPTGRTREPAPSGWGEPTSEDD